jgi:drug/metabolite transporter (DMT)-like permease
VSNTLERSAPILALLAAALFGASTPLAKLLVGGIDPWLLAGLLYAGSGIGLTIRYAFARHDHSEARLSRKDLPWLLLVIATGGIAAPVLLMFGLASTPAASASLLLNIEGLATMAIAWVVFKEYVDRRLFLGALSILAGALVLSYHSVTTIGIGTLAIMGACLAWGIDNNLTRKLSAADPVQIAAAKGIAAGTINLALASFHHFTWPSLPQIIGAATVGFFGYGLSLVLFVLALRQLGTARTSAYFSTAPFIGTVLAIFLLGEPVTLQLVLATVLMVVGVYLHLSEKHQHQHTHEALEHEHRHTHDGHHRHTHGPDDPADEPHVHWHHHEPMMHKHPHYPDIHHRHDH